MQRKVYGIPPFTFKHTHIIHMFMYKHISINNSGKIYKLQSIVITSKELNWVLGVRGKETYFVVFCAM